MLIPVFSPDLAILEISEIKLKAAALPKGFPAGSAEPRMCSRLKLVCVCSRFSHTSAPFYCQGSAEPTQQGASFC